MVFGGLLDYVIVVFLVLVFAEYTKMRAKYEKQFAWIAGGAIWFLLAYLFNGGVISVWSEVGGIDMIIGYLGWLFEIIGVLFVLVGVIQVGLKMLTK